MKLKRAWWAFALVTVWGVGCTTVEPASDDEEEEEKQQQGGGGTRPTTTSAGGTVQGTGGAGGTGVELPSGCFANEASCDPVTNAGCGPDETCDVQISQDGSPTLGCFPPPNTQQMGQACGTNGPFCAGTMTCAAGTCVAFCCSDSDCVGVPCTPLDSSLGTLGACAEEPTCQPPGAPCSAPTDCCSNNCHSGHCH